MDSQQKVTKKNTVDVFNVNQWLPGNFHRNKSDVIGFDKSQIINSSKKISRHQLLRSKTRKDFWECLGFFLSRGVFFRYGSFLGIAGPLHIMYFAMNQKNHWV